MSITTLAVIGGGPGGYVSAIRAAQLGMRVALIDERASLGGTCLNIGCIPSKALLDSSEHYYTARTDARPHGIKFDNLALDLPAMMKRKDGVVGKLTRGVSALMNSNKITVIRGRASLSGKTEVTVARSDAAANGKKTVTLTAAHIALASGSVPQNIPSCPVDGTHIITSTEALSLTEVPEKLLVIGGGAIGLELGSVWQRLGSAVTVCEMQREILPMMDAQIGRGLRRALETQGMHFMCAAAIQSAKVAGGRCTAVIKDSDGKKLTVTCDKILVAVGRRPYTDGLGLEAVGVQVDKRGCVQVDERYRTTVDSIYAIGDLVSRGPMLAHKAEEEGVALAELLCGHAGHVNYDTIPNIVYTAPEVASVGSGERELKASGVDYKTGKFSFAANGRALAMNAETGFVRVLADAETDRVLGVQIVGPRASDVIAEAVMLMEFGGSAEDMARTVHAHPTLPEVMREAALDVDNRALHAV